MRTHPAYKVAAHLADALGDILKHDDDYEVTVETLADLLGVGFTGASLSDALRKLEETE